MALPRLIGPWRYRQFARLADRFFRLWPWLWFGGVAGCALMAVLGLGQRAVVLVCCVSVYPALFGWLGFNGLAILWKWLLGVRPERMNGVVWVVFVFWLLIAVGFLAGALALLIAILRWALSG